MIGVRGGIQFFDSEAVLSALSAAERRVLSRFGAFVRRRARSSIRKRRRSAPPGQPPTNQTGRLREGILFAYDPERRSVVIGPRSMLRMATDGAPVGTTVAGVLEEGGAIQVLEEQRSANFYRRVIGRRRPQGSTRVRTVRIEARPYMRPAFEAERDKAADLWADAIR